MGSILRIGLIGLVIVTLLGTLAWLFRLEVADWMLTRELARQGYPEARLEVSALSLQRTTLRDVRLTPTRGPAADRINISHSLTTLLRRDIAAFDVEIRRLRLDLGAHAPDIGEPDAELAADDVPIERLRPLTRPARIRIVTGLIEGIPGPAGPWSLEFDGHLHGGADGLRRAEFSGQAYAGEREIELDLATRYEADTLHASVGHASAGEAFHSHSDIRLQPPWDDPRAEIFHRTRIDGEAGPAPDWWPLPWPTAGTLQLTSEQAGRPGTALPRDPTRLLARLAAGDWAGEWTLDGSDLALDDRMRGLTLSAAGRVTADGNALSVTTDGEGDLAVDFIDPAQAQRLPLPSELGRALLTTPAHIEWPAGTVLEVGSDEGLRARITPDLTISRPDDPARIRLAGTANWAADPGLAVRTFTAEIDNLASDLADIERLRIGGDLTTDDGQLDVAADLTRVQLEPLAADDVTASLRFDMIRDGDEPLRLRIAEPGRLMAGALRWEPGLRSTGTVRAMVTTGELRPATEPEWSLELETDAADWRADVFADTPVFVRTSAHTTTLSGPSPLFPLARATLENLDAESDEPMFRAEGASLDLRPGRIEAWLRFAVEALRIENGPLPLTPVRVRGQVDDWSDEGQRIRGQGAMAGDRVRMDFTGRLPPDDADPRLQLDWDELAFEPGGLQPRDLSPAVPAALRDVAGRARAGVSLRLAPDGLDGQARLHSDGLDFRVGPASVRGLAGNLAFAGLRPWRSDGDQRLDAEQLDLGVSVASPRARFAVEPRPGRGSVLVLREAAGDYGGDRLFMPGWTFDPHASSHAFDIEAGPVDVATLVQDLGIADLDASGRVSGRLPITLVDDRVIIRDGELDARNGHVRFRAEAIDITDASEPQAARAFTNLDYERLQIAINQDLDREDAIALSARGRNPDLRDGETAMWTLQLGGDLEPLIEALLAGEPLTRERLDRQLRVR